MKSSEKKFGLRRKTKTITGIVRHYHTPKSDHTPYRGQLKTDDDDEDLCVERYGRKEELSLLSQLLSDFLDGEGVTITIQGFGVHPNAKGFVWMLTKPHIYERVKEPPK